MHESYQKWLNDGKPKVYCQCPCHQEIIIKPHHSWYGIPKFICGHHMTGIPKSQKHKIKLSQIKLGIKRPENVIIKMRKTKSGQCCGKDNPNWHGGISFEPYCEKFNEPKKEEVRERDNRVCQECGKTEKENKQKLSVHHIHYDKPNCDPDLISLCRICNITANGNRDYWEEHFMNKLEERGLIKL